MDKLLKQKERLEKRLYEQNLKDNAKVSNLGWGHGMRCVKMPTFAAADRIKERLDQVIWEMQKYV